MDQKNVRLVVPAEAAFARPVRMMAASLAAGCDMSVEDVEDVRMIAEEGFVYACATDPGAVDVTFTLGASAITMDFSLGELEADDDSTELVEVLLDAVCDEFTFVDDGATLHLVKRAEGTHGE